MHARSFIPIVAVEGFFQDVEAVLGDGFGFLNFFFKRENFEIEFDDEFFFGVGHFGGGEESWGKSRCFKVV